MTGRRLAALLCCLALTACALLPGAGGRVSYRTTVESLLLAPNSPRFLVCGHRGDLFGSLLRGGGNTIESLERARRSGSDLLEIDVEATADGIPVVSHGSEVRERTLAEWRERGEPPLTLRMVLTWARGRTVLVLDLKTRRLDSVVVEVRRLSAVGFVVFYAGNRREYDDVRAGGEDLYVMTRLRRPEEVPAWTAVTDPGLILLHGDAEWLTPEIVAEIHRSGRRVFANSYTAVWHQELMGSRSSAARLFAAGIDVAQTNSPAGASRARDRALRSVPSPR